MQYFFFFFDEPDLKDYPDVFFFLYHHHHQQDRPTTTKCTDVIDAQKLLSGKKIIALLWFREDQNFEAQEFIHKNAVCKGSEDP